MLETGNMAIGLSAGGAWRVSGQRACPAAHGIACREVAQRSMHFDRHVARSNVECPSGPTADAPAHQPLTNDHGAGWPLCRGQGVSGTRDTSRASWVVRWVVGAVSVNRRRASGGFRNAFRRRVPVEGRSPPGAPSRHFSIPGHAFQISFRRSDQPAPGRGILISPGWSPGTPGDGFARPIRRSRIRSR